MTVKATFEVIKPDEVELKLTCTAKSKTWIIIEEALRDAMSEKYDHSVMCVLETIGDAINLVEGKFVALGAESPQHKED